jgi:hypothetical protein
MTAINNILTTKICKYSVQIILREPRFLWQRDVNENQYLTGLDIRAERALKIINYFCYPKVEKPP